MSRFHVDNLIKTDNNWTEHAFLVIPSYCLSHHACIYAKMVNTQTVTDYKNDYEIHLNLMRVIWT